MEESPAAHLDEQWYARLQDVSALTDGQNFLGDAAYRKEQKRAFLSGEIENPTLDYPFIDKPTLQEAEEKLVELKRDVLEFEPHRIVRQAYRWVLNEKIASVRRLQAGAEQNFSRFRRYSEFISGSPSLDVFNFTLQSIQSAVLEAAESTDDPVRNAAQDLLKVLPEIQSSSDIGLPDSNTIKRAHEETVTEFQGFLKLPSDTEELDPEQQKEVFEAALDQLPDEGWSVEIDDGTSRRSISIRQGSKRVLLPAERKRDKDELRRLIVHEIGTHVLRRINGDQSMLKLLGSGLDRVGRAEEGIAVMREQAIQNEVSDFRGLDGHLAVVLAMGLDGEPRDFRGVYEILEKFYILRNVSEGQDTETAKKNAQDKAWQRCVRTFRGSDCKTPGVCSRRDIYYREGNIAIWGLIAEDPEEMARFSTGKYDPTNPRHLWILEQLGITA